MSLKLSTIDSLLLTDAKQIESDFSSFADDQWQSLTPASLTPEQVKQKVINGDFIVLNETPSMPLFSFEEGEYVVSSLAGSDVSQETINRLASRFESKGSGASYAAQSNDNLHPAAPMEEKTSEPVVNDPEPEVSQARVPASFGQPPAPLILELIYDDKEKTPAEIYPIN